ncbi:MAG: hypothetical protein JWM25_1617 [Thermoleophilia bacterium]|nr:hypothetical protein [Thermoleophilia bacterium]MCZ4497032.1 hypothetical protein [Thermoleophilia bacterium]
MPAPTPLHETPLEADASRGHAHERGFSVVEMMVAVVIIAILAAAAMMAFGGSKTAVRSKETTAVGAVYAQAIAQFQSDHGNMLPTDADMKSPVLGPKNLLGAAYVRSVPEGVTAGRIGVTMRGSAPAECGSTGLANIAAGVQTGWVSYCPEAAPGYGIRVASRASGSSSWTDAATAKACWMGNTAKAPRCDALPPAS